MKTKISKRRNKSFFYGKVIVSVFILALVVLAFGVYYFYAYSNTTKLYTGREGSLGEADIFCSSDAKLCPDGSIAYRNPLNNCNFKECPELKYCGSNSNCLKGNCYKFEDNTRSYCFDGNPCNRCDMGQCDLLESNPIKIVCGQ